MAELLALLRVAGFVAALTGVFALARRWRRTVLSIIAVLTTVGAGLLAFAASHGIWAEPGQVHAGSPEARTAFLVGLPITTLGAAIFLVGLVPAEPRWCRPGAKGAVAEIGVRVIATYVAAGVIGVILFTVLTGYVK
jgi:hypothetical protein